MADDVSRRPSGINGGRRVLFLIDHLHMGGAERILAAVAPRIAKCGFSVRVCALARDTDFTMAERLSQAGVSVDRIEFRRLLDPLRWRKLDRYLGNLSPHIVHAQLEYANTAGLALAKRRGAATVTTLHTIEPRAKPDRAELRRRLERWSIARLADRILCVSQALLEFCRDVHHLPADRLALLRNGIDIEAFRSQHPEARARLRTSFGLSDETPVLITVAVLRPPKGIEFMIRAFAMLCESEPEAHYLIVGAGTDGPRLEALARELGVSSRIQFTGMRDDIPALLAASDIFVLPSLTEALPTVLAEAAASAKPVVATSVGGAPEMLVEGETGLLVPPGDPEALAGACRRLLASPELCRRMGEAGQRLAIDRFDLEQQADRLAELYDGLLARTGRPACA